MTAQTRAQIQKRYYAKNPEQRMLEQAKYRAKKEGCDFNLELMDVLVPAYCPVLGLRLTKGEGKRSDNSPSVDRIDPTKGYVKGNVAVISWRANRLKQDSTLREIVQLALYVVEKLEKKNG